MIESSGHDGQSVILASECYRRVAEAEQRGFQAGHEAAVAGSLTHACPPSGSGIMPCCGRTPFEVPRDDRMTLESYRVTCNAFDRGQRDMLARCIAAVEDNRVPWPTATGDLVNEGIDAALDALRALLSEGSDK